MKFNKVVMKGIFVAAFISVTGCANKEDITESVNKNGSVETAVAINHIDNLHDELVTVHKIWVKHNLFNTVEYRDTIPSLGMERTAAENEDGDTKQVEVQKDYEIYITVK